MGGNQEYSDNPAFLLLKALIAKQKIFHATGDGNVGKTTIVCSEMTGLPDFDGNQIHIVDPDSSACDQTRDIESTTTAGTITVKNAFDCQITQDTAFIISGIRSTPVEVANFEAWVKTAIGDASSHTLKSLVTKWGDIARSLDIILGARWDSSGDLGTDIANMITAIDAIATDLEGREITGNTGSIATLTPTNCSAVIGQSGKRSILQGGIIRGIQTMNAGKKVTIRVYKYNGTGWDMVDKYDVTKDSELEANIGHAAHNDYMRISVEHNDTVNRTFTYSFIVQDMEQ